jgi:hypothetical protein
MNKNHMIGQSLSGVLVMIAVIVLMTLKPSISTGLDNPPKFIDYVSSRNDFTCRIPADWRIYNPLFGLSAEEKKIYGITLFGPQIEDSLSPLISIHYYAPGNLMDKTMDKFIQVHSGPVKGLVSGKKSYGEIRKIEIAGRKAKTFERIDIRFLGERSTNPPKVSLYEKFIVIPARKDQGYYVLKFSVPEEKKDPYRLIFEESVRSFVPER